MKETGHSFLVFKISFLLLFALSQCSKKQGAKNSDSGQGDDTSPTTAVYVTLKNTTASQLALNSDPQNCHIGFTQTVQAEGLCFGPSSFQVWASNVSLGSTEYTPGADTNPDLGTPARLLGTGSGLKKGGFLEGGKFNLAEAATLRGQDNLFSKYSSKPTYNLVEINSAYVHIGFTLKGNDWEMLVPFYPQPLEAEAWVKTCYDEHFIESVKENANVLPNIKFAAGDFLFCKKSSSEACKLDQFQWFDTATQQLTSTRPTTPKQLASLAQLAGKCIKPGSDTTPPDSSFQMPSLRAAIGDTFKLYGDFSHGAPSKSNPGGSRPLSVSEADWKVRSDAHLSLSPYTIYFYEINNKVTQGNKIDVTLAFDSSEYLVLDGMRDLSTATEANILSAITTRDFLAWEKIGFEKLGGIEPGLKVKVGIDVSNASLDEIYTDIPENATPTPSK